jgi:hypothetical protein
MQSQAPSVPKRAAEDTMLTVNNADGGKTTFPVPTGTELQLHVPALHYNRMSDLFPSQGLVLTEVSQRRIGRIPIPSGHRGSLRTIQRRPSCHLVQVGLVPS